MTASTPETVAPISLAHLQDHHEVVPVTRDQRPHVLIVVASPLDLGNGFTVGFWASELTHPYLEFTKLRYNITIASQKGSRVGVDSFSDPRDPSKWSADDLISMGFLSTPELAALLENTARLADLDLSQFDAILVAGGMAPMFSFREDEDIKNALRIFYESERPTAALCHGVSALMDVTLSDGSRLIEGKTITGFANVEEDYGRRATGMDRDLWPWRIEDTARSLGANYVQAGLFRSFAIRDGRLITGQQQYSGAEVARLVIEALGV
jgi:putative intracellular protease/amidase